MQHALSTASHAPVRQQAQSADGLTAHGLTARAGRCFLWLVVLASFAAPAFTQARPGSLYDPGRGPQSAIADKTARKPGDLITIIINEEQVVGNQETSTLSKSTDLDYQLTNFDIKPSFFSTLPALTASSQDDFTGTANYQKNGTFEARITAIVMDVTPNGNMVLKGRREIRVDNETKLIEFSGMIRSFDVRPDNTVASELVAEAQISYQGQGTLTNATNRTGIGRVFHAAISWLWPF